MLVSCLLPCRHSESIYWYQTDVELYAVCPTNSGRLYLYALTHVSVGSAPERDRDARGAHIPRRFGERACLQCNGAAPALVEGYYSFRMACHDCRSSKLTSVNRSRFAPLRGPGAHLGSVSSLYLQRSQFAQISLARMTVSFLNSQRIHRRPRTPTQVRRAQQLRKYRSISYRDVVEASAVWYLGDSDSASTN